MATSCISARGRSCPGKQQLSFGMSYILIHWLLGMVSSKGTYLQLECVGMLLVGSFSRRHTEGELRTWQGFLMSTAGFLSVSRSILRPGETFVPHSCASLPPFLHAI